MTGLNHTLAGTLIGITLTQPLLIIPVAFLSHFLLDALPHFGHSKLVPFNTLFKKYLVFEAISCVLILSFALYQAPELWLAITLGAFFATLPDFSSILYYNRPKWAKWFYDFHYGIQWAEIPRGWIIEVIFLVAGISLLVNLT